MTAASEWTANPESPTHQQWGNYIAAYDYLNRELFTGHLPACILTFGRDSRQLGYFLPDAWQLDGHCSVQYRPGRELRPSAHPDVRPLPVAVGTAEPRSCHPQILSQWQIALCLSWMWPTRLGEARGCPHLQKLTLGHVCLQKRNSNCNTNPISRQVNRELS